jgi:carboxylesterase
MPTAIRPGAEPFSARAGAVGVLLLHGFTGSPDSMRPIAEALHAATFSVELPLLPGHGTTLEDLQATRFEDWSAAAAASYRELASSTERVSVMGLSMGGTLALLLAATYPAIASVVVVNPLVEPVAESFLEVLSGALAAGTTAIPGTGSDIARPSVTELCYDAMPIAPLLTLFDAVAKLGPALSSIRCPVLCFTSRHDHVVPPSSADYLRAAVRGPFSEVVLERSAHVATLDYDSDELVRQAVDFVA